MSNELNVALIALSGVVLSVVGSGLVSWFVAKRAGSQRLADYRREWIEGLRQKLAAFAVATFDYQMEQGKRNPSGTVSEKEHQASLRQMQLYFEVLLNLNPKEAAHVELERRLAKLAGGEVNFSEDSIIPIARSVLKAEWDRLKTEV